MKKVNKKLGFTLIELLVVITIIGILATGAVTIYTGQIQKARDSTRLNDIKAVQSAVEQVYQDSGEYPHSNDFATGSATVTGVKTYIERIPEDPKQGQTCNGGTTCDYFYKTGVDNNNISYGEYEMSIAFENTGNVNSKANNNRGDSGNDDQRLEIGIDVANNNTSNSGTLAKDGCEAVGTAGPTALIVLGPEC